MSSGLEDFWRVYLAHYDDVSAETMRAAAEHAELGAIVRGMSPERIHEDHRQSRERLEQAIAGDWGPYEADLRMQGTVYAKMGVSIEAWFDLVGAFHAQLVPLLAKEYAGEPARLAAALTAMQAHVDRALAILTKQYLVTKEELIAESEGRSQTLFHSMPVPMWVYDRETLRFLAVNRAAIDHYGYSEAELLEMTLADIRFPEDVPKLLQEQSRLRDDVEMTDLGEWRHRRKDGTAILVDVQVKNFTFAGRAARLVVANDVTERRRAVRTIEESEERYRSLVAATSAIVWTLDAEGKIAAPQPSWEAYTGQSFAEQKGFGWSNALHAGDRPALLDAWQEARRQKQMYQVEGRLWHAPSGHHRWVAARTVPLLDADGAVREWVGTIYDIEERKRTEQPGRFFTLSLDLLCVAGVDGYFKRLNPAFSILGWSEQELLSRPFIDFVHPEDVEATLAEVEKLSRGVPTIQFENRYRCKDGSYRVLLWTTAPDPSGVLYAAARDITERKRMEDDLVRASRAKSDFLAMMSHELRTPLNSIIGFSEILIDAKFGALNDKQRRYLSNVHQSGRHLLGLINDLLDLSKIEAGKLDVVIQPCSARALAAEAAATLAPLAEGKQIRLVLDPADAAPLPPIGADAARVKQVLYNLLSNAVKFTPPGGMVTVSCALRPDAPVIRTTVSDTGPGISEDDRQRLFTRFTQLATTRGSGGTGLGLALSRQLVLLMGGTVDVESTPGVGSRFFVDLPVDASQREARPRAGQLAAGERGPLALIVDDDAEARELLEVTLQSGGFRTLSAANGDEAIALTRRERPDVITLDVFLPTIDGWDVLRILKSDPDTAAIPVVMVSISSDRRMAFTLGAVEHLVKPIERDMLLEMLSRRSFTTKVKERPIHILVIDDDPRQLELVRATLEPHGFRVRTEATGRAGLQAAAAAQFDLLLLDLILPDLSGIEVVSELKRDPRTRHLPILLVTGHDLSREDRQRLNGDIEAVLAKATLGPLDLVAEVASVLGRFSAR